jgi:plasmid stabilization system protein ParE
MLSREACLCPYALSDRDNIFTYVEKENPRTAIHIDQQIDWLSACSPRFQKAADLAESRGRENW